MAVANGFGKVVTSGSVFMYDTGDTVNSYIGEPTINYIWHQNPRIDTTYESYMPEAGAGTITQNHPGAIRVYNENGSDISYYVNTGVGDWTNQRHAYWVYDQILKRPVVRMYNQNGSWQSKYHNPGIGSFTNIGITAGTQYTISWLQYVESLDRSAYVGYYSYSNTYGYNDFWDGLQAAYNTKTHTWQRVYATFTATNNGQLSNYHGGYMYGHAVGSGELRIADVQLEVKNHATQYSNSYTRSATQGLLPIIGNSTIDLSNVSFDSNAQIVFDGTDDRISLTPSTYGITNQFTIEVVCYPTKQVNGMFNFGGPNGSDRGIMAHWPWSSDYGYFDITNTSGGFFRWYKVNAGILNVKALYHFILKPDGQMLVKQNNQIMTPSGADTFSGNVSLGTTNTIGAFGSDGSTAWAGNIYMFKIYNRALTDSETTQNYNKYKSRFNLT